MLEEHLRAARVPAKVVGAASFFERKEVKDVVAYLAARQPAMDSACERVVNVPARGLGETTVDRLRAAARASSVGTFEAARLAALGDVAGIGAAARKKLQGFVELLDGLRDVIAQGASVAETIIQVVDRSGLRAKLEADDSGESRDRLDNLTELVTIASDFDDESAEAQSVDAFLERISLSAPADNATQGETVTLMTIHIAKGLEWPAVFITGMEDGLFPSLREREGVSEDAQLEEERRLAYVAITRARRQLVFTHARTRRVWGEVRLQGPSRFLEDLPPAALAQPAHRGSLTPKAPAIVDGSWAATRRIGRSRFGRGSLGGVGSDEFDQRAPDDDPVYQVDADVPEDTPFRSGDTVAHAVLGIGRVVAVSGNGKDVRVIVDFPTPGERPYCRGSYARPTIGSTSRHSRLLYLHRMSCDHLVCHALGSTCLLAYGDAPPGTTDHDEDSPPEPMLDELEHDLAAIDLDALRLAVRAEEARRACQSISMVSCSTRSTSCRTRTIARRARAAKRSCSAGSRR